jgi:hypothetical protein
MAFTTRMILRDYAFLETLYKSHNHHRKLQFAVISTTAWIVAFAFALVAGIGLVLRDVIPPQLNIATASKPTMLIECLAIVLGSAYFVESRARPFRLARPASVDDFKTMQDRFKWWLTTFSIFIFVGALAGILMVFHGYV